MNNTAFCFVSRSVLLFLSARPEIDINNGQKLFENCEISTVLNVFFSVCENREI